MVSSMSLLQVLVVFGTAALDAPHESQQGGPVPGFPAISSPSARTDKPATSAKEALTAASRLRREANGKDGPEKLEILMRAAQAYESAAQTFSTDPVGSGEAWFRAGEIYRTVRRMEEATRCFETAAKNPASGEFGARATNEIGHIHRKLKSYDQAIESYENVLKTFARERQECARALTWQGKVHLLQKNVEIGHQILLSVGEQYPEFPEDDIRNVDTVALDWIEAGKVSEARALVEKCIERHSVPGPGKIEVAADVQKALDRMRSPEKLGIE